MKIEHEFSVAQPLEKVWEAFQDVPEVADCLPGAELTGESDDGYQGKVSVRLGPMTAVFEGTATIETEESEHRATISGKGVDRRGGSRGQVKMVYALEGSDPATTQVSIDADITLSGPAAQFGRTGLINEISSRLIGDFVSCLEGKLGGGASAETSGSDTSNSATSTAAASTPSATSASSESKTVDGLALFAASLFTVVRRFLAKTLRTAADLIDPDEAK
ncbi:MAG: membrane oxidoreductase [Acidimicrobiia bacterium]|nr:membrane oxidoreductase [Acidimicrobiia bacterium]